ncbi:ABC transporter ATP-binding protein [Herpetosiphon giganteus]|uniref:ABC transporter ATP-binding protein n=1 Tax=Herpetosiphon giganteus TaxID=2029754 RepID=UPI0019578649|nr:ABC transporter ATP-binding protein [Herpetosiphon giganteus]MBM7845958.1 putative ABC transport system ATP-binding protein [Herpetosiphon giganteus]
MALIELQAVEKAYTLGGETVRAAKGINLTIEQGEFVVILGPSGSGKTTLLNLLGGLEKPDTGKILVDGQDIAALGETKLSDYRRTNVGLIFQFFNLFPTLSALENVNFAAELVGKQARKPVEMLEAVGLGSRLNHYPGQLSGGQQQRVAIARALVKNPKLILADEPTGSLDYKTGIDVLKTMRDFNTSTGQTCIIVTHNATIAGMADRVIHVGDGQVHNSVINPTPKLVEELEW